AQNPSGDTIGFFLNGNFVMNVAGGFTSGFSFYYDAYPDAGTVVVYDGLNATGNILQTLNLPVTGVGCFTAAFYDCWQTLGVTFSGTAKAVHFSGSAHY